MGWVGEKVGLHVSTTAQCTVSWLFMFCAVLAPDTANNSRLWTAHTCEPWGRRAYMPLAY